jgi:hypothetical protein
MVIVPEQEDAASGTDGRSMCEGSKSEVPNIGGGLLVNVIQFGFLNAGNMT